VLFVPLVIKSDVAGRLEFYYRRARAFAPGQLELAESIGRHVAYAVERARLAQKAEELVRLQERQRIAQALHDTVAQMLFRIGIEAEWCQQHASADAAVAERIETVRRLVARSSHELRSAIFALRDRDPSGDNSLVVLLLDQVQEFQAESGIPATFVVSPDLPPLPPAAAEAIFRIVREALTNVHKHAHASAVIVSLRGEEDAVTVTIQDDGIGLEECTLVDPGVGGLHFGIRTMRELASQLGGRFLIDNNDEHGTMVKVRVPVGGVK
jgi:signal transduction histidine kinase